MKAARADFSNANLRGATLTEGDFTRALFADAVLAGREADARTLRRGGVDQGRPGGADLTGADLGDVDARHATLAGAQLAGAS